jgi:two-component system NtrC family sensor kinase
MALTLFASGRVIPSLRVLLAAAALVPVALFALFAVQNRQEVLDRAEERARRTVDILHEHARNIFRTHEIVLEHLDDRISGMSWDEVARSEGLYEYLKGVVNRVGEISSIWLIDKEGRHRASSFEFPIPPVDVSDRDYFRAEKQSDAGTFIGQPSIGKATGTPFFAVARRRSAPADAFDGIVSAAIEPDFFNRFYKGIVPEPNRAIVLVRADGSVLARDPAPATGLELFTYKPDSPFMRAFASADSGVLTAKGDMDGIERLYAFRKLEGYPAYIMLGLYRGSILAQWHKNLADYAKFGAPAWLLLVLAAWVALQRAKREQAAAADLHEEMERRRTAEKALLQSQKLESIGQLTGGIAHDFNNLLTVVSGNLDLIVPKLRGQEPILHQLEAVQRAAQRGAQLTRQLLAFARRQSLAPETVDLVAGVREISELLNRSLRGDIRTEFRLTSGLWLIEVDRAQLEMAILNVAMNARDAMPGGGTLTIEARNVRLDPGKDRSATMRGDSISAAAWDTDGVEAQGDFVALSVSDTGGGIPPDVLKRVFEPFFTTKDVGEGTGLGLSQVYGFVRQSGGDVQIDSMVGKGTRVTLYLPRARSVAQPTSVHRAAAAPGDPATILVVEDDEAVADVVQAQLEARGHRVVMAQSGRAGLQRVGSDRSIDLVLSDIVMAGGMSGVDLAREIRKRRPELPVLLMTGYSDTAAEAMELGFPVLRKPYAGADLDAAIGACLKARRLAEAV